MTTQCCTGETIFCSLAYTCLCVQHLPVVTSAHIWMSRERLLLVSASHPSACSCFNRYVDYLNGIIDHDSRQLLGSRPTVEAAQKAAKAAAAGAAKPGGKRSHGGGAKGPKGLGLGGAKGLGSSGGGSGGNGSSDSQAVAASPAALRATIAGDNTQAAHAAAMRHLCLGLAHMSVALVASGVLAPPALPFNSAAERFEQRFGSFHILTRPEPLGYQQFEASVELRHMDPRQLLASAANTLANVRARVRWECAVKLIEFAVALPPKPPRLLSAPQHYNPLCHRPPARSRCLPLWRRLLASSSPKSVRTSSWHSSAWRTRTSSRALLRIALSAAAQHWSFRLSSATTAPSLQPCSKAKRRRKPLCKQMQGHRPGALFVANWNRKIGINK